MDKSPATHFAFSLAHLLLRFGGFMVKPVVCNTGKLMDTKLTSQWCALYSQNVVAKCVLRNRPLH